VNIKAQGLFNAAKWIERELGQAALRDVLRGCSPAVRDRYTSAIVINWHPVEEFVEVLEVAEKLLGRNDGKLAEAVGAAGARENLRGAMVRAATYLANPEFMVKRIASLWSQFNDEGTMEVLRFDPEEMAIEVKGLTKTHPLFCATLTGWATEVALHFGWKSASARHVRCRAKGEARCLWELSAALPDASVPASRKGPARQS
jgi:hypothetical protein